MGIVKSSLKGTAVLTAGEAVNSLASLARNILLARLLTKADFGIAATFALVITMFELSSKMAVRQLIVQDREGDDPRFLGAAQSVQLMAGLAGAAAVYFAARPLSHLFNLHDARWALRSLALIPLLKGFEHLDVWRMNRQLRFLPSVAVESVPQMLTAIVAWPLALWLGDYRAVLWLLIIKGFLTCIGTHFSAERPYAMHLDPIYLRRIMTFGWPLILNGFFMFGVFQGDRFFVGTFYSMGDLGAYAAAASLTLLPGTAMAQVLSAVMLPLIAEVQNNQVEYERRYSICLQLVALFSAGYSLLLIVGGEALMQSFFGSKYRGTGIILAWMAASNAFRILRVAPAIGSLARADSKNQMISNAFRALALIPAAVVSSMRQPLWLFTSTALIGEGLAFVATFVRFSVKNRIAFICTLKPAFLVTGCVSAAALFALLGAHQWELKVALPCAICMAGIGLLWGIFMFPALKIFISQFSKRQTTCGPTFFRAQ